jgi:hypothetical protein
MSIIEHNGCASYPIYLQQDLAVAALENATANVVLVKVAVAMEEEEVIQEVAIQEEVIQEEEVVVAMALEEVIQEEVIQEEVIQEEDTVAMHQVFKWAMPVVEEVGAVGVGALLAVCLATCSVGNNNLTWAMLAIGPMQPIPPTPRDLLLVLRLSLLVEVCWRVFGV